MPDWKGPKIERMKRSALDITGTTGNKREKSKKLSNENKKTPPSKDHNLRVFCAGWLAFFLSSKTESF